MKAVTSDSQALAQADLLLLAARLLTSNATGAGPAEGTPELRDLLSRAGAGLLRESLTAVCTQAALADPAALHVERTRLFEGGVACPINETAYVRRDKGAILADICGFHEAFGFQRAEECGEKPDHLVAELEFCAVLLVMQVRARQQDQREHSETARDAFRSFVEDHLLAWWAAFGERLMQTATHPAMRAAAEFHRALCLYLADWHGLPAQPEAPAEPEEGTPYDCGQAPPQQLVQLGRPPRAADASRP